MDRKRITALGCALCLTVFLLIPLGRAAALAAGDPEGTLRFEVENWTTPKGAWQKDKASKDKWNLWSTDKDAHKKWSGGVVLQSPRVMADRKSGEEGAPVLHTVLTGIPKGTYDIELSARTRPIGVSRDGKTWQKSSGGIIARDVRIEDGKFELWVDDRYAADNPDGRGSCYYDCIVLYPSGPEYIAKVLGSRPRVKGWAKSRREERLDRGVVAMRTPQGVYVGWRLLKGDPADIAFDVFRKIEGGQQVKVNGAPVRETTDFLDTSAPADATPVYTVRPAGAKEGFFEKLFGQRPRSPEGSAKTAVCKGPAPYVSVKLDGDHKFQKIGFVDLDGDTRLDYVIKQPEKNIDPCGSYWYRSPDTYKIEAYTHDGKLLWRNDLGWAIERGIWYSPFIAHDLDGDGKAEVAAKIGEGDPRNEKEEGRVTSGPEWMVVWDGMTGKELDRAPWPSRDGFRSYNVASRNQMAVAYLDGKTPCLLALRGTYGRMKVHAYQFKDGKLKLLWKYDNEKLPRRYWGQGEHFTHAIDVDNDGRDEVMLGSIMLDDNGIPLWTTGMGHNDHGYVGDIDPHRPGLEIYYGVETHAQKNGMCLVDAPTGKFIWGFGEPTRHIHAAGMCADIDPTVPGLECFGLDCLSKKPSIRKGPWLWAANGKLLWFDKPLLPKTYSLNPIYWDADLQKEILRGGKIFDYAGGNVAHIGAGRVLIADVIGDWREEVIASFPGEIRIYSTTIPATDRRVCLLQDPIYRADVTMDTMGYTKEPMTSYCLEAHWPGLNLTVMTGEDEKRTCRAVITAPLGRAVTGRLKLACDGLRMEPNAFDVNVAPGGRSVMTAALASDADFGGERLILGTFSGKVHAATTPSTEDRLPTDPVGPLPTRAEHEVTLRGRVPIRVPAKIPTGLPMVEAETISAQGGGKVRIRTDKAGASKKAISHWDDKGHWIEWKIAAPKAGQYRVAVRYCTPHDSVRAFQMDGKKAGDRVVFPATGGFGGKRENDWDHAFVKDASGKPIAWKLKTGTHTIRMTNLDGKGMNVDCLMLVPVK
ncbi:MAG: hypothetical protein GXP25_06540 [Planctomycetes bacterium]|nr:hypothetical protein [Planctomycetota bacterium]